ncbi:MAG: DUF4391 domain-containing protein [Bacteroidales bacterium]|nr:DUF4391 domain-containing protein [Bacteroidales bacterium]
MGGNTKMRRHFTDDIENITWIASLVSETLNVSESEEVDEIAAFVVKLKKEDITNDIFVVIDTMMPRHTVFILEYSDYARLLINYKERISGGNTEKRYRIIKTYRTEFAKKEEVRLTISGLSMDSVYASLVRQIAGDNIKFPDRNLRDAVEKTEIYDKMLKEAEALRNKLNAECQPNKKFDLHKELIKVEAEIRQYETENNITNKTNDNG